MSYSVKHVASIKQTKMMRILSDFFSLNFTYLMLVEFVIWINSAHESSRGIIWEVNGSDTCERRGAMHASKVVARVCMLRVCGIRRGQDSCRFAAFDESNAPTWVWVSSGGEVTAHEGGDWSLNSFSFSLGFMRCSRLIFY